MTHLTKRFGLALAAAATLALGGLPAAAVTVAYWDFEDGVDGQEFTPVGTENGSGGSVDTVNGILMRGFNEAFGPSWTSNTSDNQGLAMNLERNTGPNVTSDGYVTEGALHNWSPTEWTIETHALLRDLTGWNSLIGRDGSTPGVGESDFYLQNNGIDDRYRVNFGTVGGARYILDAAPTGGIQEDAFYGIVVRSDGVTLDMWIDDGTTGYQQVGSLDMSGQSVADNALIPSNFAWTFGRAWFGGQFVDHIDGIMDNVRFSDSYLSPGEFLPFDLDPNFVLDRPGLVLVVNPNTGQASLRNDTGGDLSFDYYRIDSEAGALSTTGWNSLSDQGVDATGAGPGESWDEVTAANSANLLVEQFLTGDTTLAPGQSIAIGSPYTGSGPGDLTINFAAGGGGLQEANVFYSTLALPGDFNGDNKVDAADYTVWRDTVGTATLTADHSGDGKVNVVDYNIWAANFGATLAVSVAVPEPTAALLLVVAALGAAKARR